MIRARAIASVSVIIGAALLPTAALQAQNSTTSAAAAHSAWRVETAPGAGPIDALGSLPDGTNFNGPAELRRVLLSKREALVEALTERLLTYALGRGVEEYDDAAIRKVNRDAAANQKLSSVILGIVNSTPFQMRRVSHGNT